MCVGSLGCPVLEIGSSIFIKRSENCNLWKAVVFHSGNMNCPVQLYFEYLCFDTSDIDSFKDFDVCDEVSLTDVEDG